MQTPSKRTAKFSGHVIRPTADRAREAQFNIIGREVEGAAFLDLYAGTGAIGLEALSRNAQQAVFVDCDPQAVQLIEKNIKICGFSDGTLVFKRDLSKGLYFLGKLLPETRFSIIFVDPPYRKGLSAAILSEIVEANLLTPDGLVVVEDVSVSGLPDAVAGLGLVDRRRYGETGFWFYRLTGSENKPI